MNRYSFSSVVYALALWVALCALSLGLTSEASAQGASFTPLGLLPGGAYSQGLAVSADGAVAVGHSFPGEAFRWTSAEGMVGLGELPGGVFGSRADDASADGAVIVGRSYSDSGLEAFRWTEADDVMNGLGDLEGGSFLSIAYGVSADGAVVVGYSNSASGKEAFRWTEADGMMGLGDLDGSIFSSEAHAVSADGAVVVGRSLSASGLEAFRWVNGSMVGLGDLDGGTFSSVAEGVSPDGTIVVGYGNSANGREAFLSTEAGVMVGLGDLEGGNFFSSAKDVSADGAVVVGGGTSAVGGEAFRWTPSDGMQSIQDLLEAQDVDLTGWSLISAEAVSDDGTTIVGQGTNPEGTTVAWVAFLPRDSGDSDGDGVPDLYDNCPDNANPDQEDSNRSKPGADACAPNTVNGRNNQGLSFHAGTPFYRKRASSYGIIEFSAEAGLGAPRKPDIGLSAVDDQKVMKLKPHRAFAMVGGSPDEATLDTSAKLKQSTWQSIMSPELFTTSFGAPIRFHSATHANGFSVGYEVDLAEIPALGPSDYIAVAQELELPAGLCLDDSEVTAGGGIGRLTIREGSGDCSTGTAVARISPTNFVAFGKRTVLQDKASPPEFFGLQRLTEELDAQPLTATAGPADPVGHNFYNPSGADQTVHAPLVQVSYTLEENQADGVLGRTTVSSIGPSRFIVSMIVDAAAVERNRQTSSVALVGQNWSSLTPVDFGSGEVAYGRHMVVFDEEAVITGHDVTLELENTVGSPPTFDGLPVPYDLLPNGGGTAAVENSLEQAQTGVGCGGCKWNWTGDSKIRFKDPLQRVGLGGGAGVSISAGGRVGPAHPCLASDPVDRTSNTGRCEVNKVKRATFRMKKLLVEGSMSGLAGVESDIDIEEFKFHQARDPNVTDEIALHAAGGLGCSADLGVRIGRNPSDGEILSNVPLDLAGCTPDEVGEGICAPTPLSSPPGTGISNCRVGRVELQGMNSDNNPLGTDLTVPSGCGVTLASRAGKGEIGPSSYNPQTDRCEADPANELDASLIEGFECMIATSGGANVDPETGAPLEFDDPNAVPPNVYCLDKIRGDNLETGLGVGPNSDVRANRLSIERTQFCAVNVGAGGANVETVETTRAAGSECPSIDGVHCRSVAEELASPSSKMDDVNYLAVASSGKSAPHKLRIKKSKIGLDANGNPSAGKNPALPPLNVDEDLVAEKTLTIARRQASLAKAPICIAKGADTIGKQELLFVKVEGSNVGTSNASISVDNRDSRGAQLDKVFTFEKVCYSPGGGDCIRPEDPAPVVATAEEDFEIVVLDTKVVEQAASLPQPAGDNVSGDHKCYKASGKRAPIDQAVTVIDDFFEIDSTATVLQPFEFCNPVQKDGGAIPDPQAHLTCYELDEATPADRTVTVQSEQFGGKVALGGATRLCTPTIKQAVDGVEEPTGDLSPDDLQVNHFVCYERAQRAKKVADKIVDLKDQFEETKPTRVKDVGEGPFVVCNAVHTGGGIIGGAGVAQQLACYKIQDERGEPKFPGVTVTAEDQFGDATIRLDAAELLCEPATIMPVSP